MQKLTGFRSLEGFRSLVGSTSTAMKAANPKPSSDAGGSSYGSFANLKITAEKLVKEQASVKTDLEMAHTKLRRATEQINLLEGKLQQAVNENAKLKVKQKEDSKLWQGLDSKISSTKTLCDQLTETLQQLASQTEQAEEDKKFFEEMLGKNSKALDEFNCLLHDLSTKLECAEQKIIAGKQEMLQIKQEKEEMDRSHKEQLYSNDTTIKEKVTELDKEHASMSSHVSRMLCSFERFYEMAQEEKMLIARSSKEKFEHLQRQYVDLSSENNALKIEIEELKSRIIELQKTQEIVMVQHVEECQVAEDKIRRLESGAETSASNISLLETLASELQGRVQKLLEDSTLAENHKQELLEKILKLESDNQELQVQLQSIMEEKSNNDESLQGEISKRDQQVDTLENQINQLRCVLNEKEQLYTCSVEREKTLEDQKLQHEEECQRMQEELELQKSKVVIDIFVLKEEKQRTLLQLQWKVMGENQQVDQEVNSKKEYSVSSMKRRDTYGRKEHELQLGSPETKLKDVNLSGILQSPISNMLRKVEKGSQDIPKHRKVTHHEYEVETANGRITKRRKTRSTVMISEPNTQKSLHNTADKDVTKIRKVPTGSHAHPANIGELFSEGSLNPYADDPYAFD
ncbi:hypothetical protein C2845_PM16G09450 [Panicum miliaceum]|uniref:Synaptonemal complex protein 1-like n=1 Tax=Panicum miliaceum TaxID=4540 RepID=A0A3L6PZU9_PANMI|nr:hypothetical protein C2845_PM16G09450 [Panicum miliaceum]